MEQQQNSKLKISFKEEFSIREFILRYIHVIPWAIITISITLMIAYTKIRYTNPVYQAFGKVIMKSDGNPRNSAKGKFADLYMMQTDNSDLDDEMELIKSSSMARLVVQSLGLQQQYYIKGSFRTTPVHTNMTPVECKIISITDSTARIHLEILVLNNSSFKVLGNPKPIKFGEIFHFASGTFIINKKDPHVSTSPNKNIIITWTPDDEMAKSIASQIQLTASTNGSHVLTFSITHENAQIAKDVINGFLSVYEQYSLNDKRAVAKNTIEFINSQLGLASEELSGVESNLQGFREQNKVIAPETQASLFMDKMSTGEKLLEEQGVKLKLIEYMGKYLADNKNQYRGLPVVLGMDDANFGVLVSDYNRLQLQREIALNTMPSGNPIIKDLETAMDKQRNEMELALTNAKESLLLGIKDYQGKSKLANAELNRVPGKQRTMLDIMRKQKIAEELYTFLLERKLETSIGSASTISSIQILEPGFSSGVPISPNTKGIYMFAFAIGLVFPVLVVFIKELLNDKIKNKSDLDVFTTVPVLGEVGHSESNKSLIITTSDRRFISEQFRILRTNLQYIFLKKQASYVLLVTSSVSGEGKSFISTNMSAVMAVSGKKTVLLEFDIRKPRVMQGLGMEYKRNKGISNYLVGNVTLQEIIQQVPDMENFYVIPCGPIPPNPAELILSERLKQFFDEVRAEFEMVIVDTAPVGLVSDGYVLSQFSDASLYVVRHNFTLKQQIENIQMIHEAGKLPKMSLVINDVRALIGYGRYYGYVNYGHMSYGAEVSHYFDVTKRKGFFRFLSKLFGV